MARYFRHNPLRQTLTEDLRIARSWKVVFLWGAKLFRKRLGFSSEMPLPVPFGEFELSSDQVSPRAGTALQTPLEQAQALGFAPPRYQVVRTLRGESVTTSVASRHADGEMVLRVVHCRVGTVHPAGETTALYIFSRLHDGRLVVTTSQRATFNRPGYVIPNRLVGAALGALVVAHRQLLDRLRLQSSPELVRSDLELAAFIDRMESDAMDHNLRRGLYEEVPPEEVERIKATPPALPATPGGPLDTSDATILAEMDRIQNRRGSGRTAALLATVSLVAFFLVSRLKWEVGYVAILAGCLVFHELGHFVAMRLFRYRNLRMFFVPLLGAAVTGQNFNVSGWKKVLVSLAGPVPGILLGLALGIASIATGNPLLERIALVSLILNGINLLPVLPLDGGWTLNTILFSRHPVLEAVFRVLAALALIGATFAQQGRFWMYLGIFMLLGVPTSYRLARIARHLRSENLPPPAADATTVPADTAQVIIRELKAGLPGRHTAKTLATHALAVFEKLNARPPGLVASALLLVLYVGAIATACLGTGLIFASRFGLLDDFKSADHQSQPAWEYTGGSFQQTGDTDAARQPPAPFCYVGVFTNASGVSNAFEALRARLQPDELLTAFGRTLFVTPQTGDTNWPARLKTAGAVVFTERPASNDMAWVRLECFAPDTATATRIEEALAPYFESSWPKPWPPWVPQPDLTPPQRQAQERVRHTWGRLQQMEKAVARQPELRRAARNMTAALRGADTNSLAQFMQAAETHQARVREARRRALAGLSVEADPQLDRELLSAYRADLDRNRETAATNAITWRQLAADRLGRLPMADRLPSNNAGWRAARSGFLRRQWLLVRLSSLTFYRTDLGLPALAEYLHQQGCQHIRYQVDKPLPSSADLEEDEQ